PSRHGPTLRQPGQAWSARTRPDACARRPRRRAAVPEAAGVRRDSLDRREVRAGLGELRVELGEQRLRLLQRAADLDRRRLPARLLGRVVTADDGVPLA